MDELLKLIFGVRPAQAAVQEPQAFPITDQPVSVMDIPRISEYEADMRIAPAQQAQPAQQESGMRFPSFSMPNFQMPMPNVPEYMSGLIGDPAAAQQQAQRSGLLNAAIALLEAGGPQPQKLSLGQAAGRGLGAYQQGVQGTFDQMLQGMLIKQKLNQQPELPGVVGQYNAALKAGFISPETTLTQFITLTNPPGTTVKVGEQLDPFQTEARKSQAKEFSDISKAGMKAQRSLQSVNKLSGILEKVDTGGKAAFKQIAGNFGIKTEGLDDIQAAQAIINKLVPEQRLEGSGTMSDADLALYKESLPRIINQPGGNKLIVKSIKDINSYVAEEGKIANEVLDGKITPAEGRARIAALGNPIEDFLSKASGGSLDLAEQARQELQRRQGVR